MNAAHARAPGNLVINEIWEGIRALSAPKHLSPPPAYGSALERALRGEGQPKEWSLYMTQDLIGLLGIRCRSVPPLRVEEAPATCQEALQYVFGEGLGADLPLETGDFLRILYYPETVMGGDPPEPGDLYVSCVLHLILPSRPSMELGILTPPGQFQGEIAQLFNLLTLVGHEGGEEQVFLPDSQIKLTFAKLFGSEHPLASFGGLLLEDPFFLPAEHHPLLVESDHGLTEKVSAALVVPLTPAELELGRTSGSDALRAALVERFPARDYLFLGPRPSAV